MGRQSRFHLAVLGVGSALGGFLFAFSRFTLSSAHPDPERPHSWDRYGSNS